MKIVLSCIIFITVSIISVNAYSQISEGEVRLEKAKRILQEARRLGDRETMRLAEDAVRKIRAQIGIKADSYLCSLFGELDSGPYNYSFGMPDPSVDRIIEDILKVQALAKNFEVYETHEVPNAAALVQGETRLILYNPDFLRQINNQTRNSWAIKSIFAHEVGHHLNGHTIQSGGSRPDIELQADEYSGAAVRWMGGNLDDALIAMSNLAPEQGSYTHPGRSDRLRAIESGWRNAIQRGGGTNTGGGGSSPPQDPYPDSRNRTMSEYPPTNPYPRTTNPRYPSPNPVPVSYARACCNAYNGIPMCGMMQQMPVANPCTCYLLGRPVSQGISCN